MHYLNVAVPTERGQEQKSLEPRAGFDRTRPRAAKAVPMTISRLARYIRIAVGEREKTQELQAQAAVYLRGERRLS